MLISLNWLKDYLPAAEIDPKELAHKLTMATVEVEEIVPQDQGLDKVVVGQIKEIIKHPKADKLSICQVDAGAEKYLQIVCGGKNIYQEMKVAVSLIGSQVFWHGQKTLQKIEKTKIRSIESEGMICAPSELGLEAYFPESDENVIDLKNYEAKNGTPLVQILNLTDYILEIENKTLTNRPDLWGHYGLAREVAALYQLKLKTVPQIDLNPETNIKLKVKVENSLDCPKYLAVVIDGITIADSPQWLKNKLLAVGQRPINNIVDITNFVMLELGQPLHAFSYNKLANQEIIIKRAEKGKFTTLDGQERMLSSEILMINDGKKPIAIAGIMGGQNSEIDAQTKTIVIESANFNPDLIRRASVQLGLRTEASSRYEKGLDPLLTSQAIKRVGQLIKQIIPESKIASELIEEGDFKPEERVIELDLEWLQKRLGSEISLKTACEILALLGFANKAKKNLITVTVPSFRAGRDVSQPEDLVEEVARLYGFNKIVPTLPSVTLKLPDINWERKYERMVKNFITLGSGFTEVNNYSLISEQDVEKIKLNKDDFFRVKNFISADQTRLRTNLVPGLLKNAYQNLKYFDHFRIFEIGRVFKKKAGDDWRDPDKKYSLPQQEKHLAGLVVGEKDSFLVAKGTINDILEKFNVNYELKADENYHPWIDPRRALKIIVNDQIIGSIGKIHQSVKEAYDIETATAFFGLNFSKLTKIISGEKKFKPLLKFPEVIKDLSIIINHDVLWGDIEKEIVSSSGLVTKVELFDVYQSDTLGKSKKSLAFHLTFYHQERTLISNEVELEIKKIMANLETKFQATVRKQ